MCESEHIYIKKKSGKKRYTIVDGGAGRGLMTEDRGSSIFLVDKTVYCKNLL